MTIASSEEIRTYQRCEQQYVYRFIDRLEPTLVAPNDLLRTMLRSYLHAFYKLHAAGRAFAVASSEVAHGMAVRHMQMLHTEQCEQQAAAYEAFQDQEKAALFWSLPMKAELIADHYVQIRGHDDVEREIVVAAGVLVNDHDTLDLLTKDPTTGDLTLWEHRIEKDGPSPQGFELRDLRGIGIAHWLQQYGWPSYFRLNYLYPDIPATPKINKDGSIARSAITTTWETYAAAVYANGGDPADYADMQVKLENKATTKFFPRIEIPLAKTLSPVLDNDERISDLIALTVDDQAGQPTPVVVSRHFSHYCASCPYKPLCTAWAMGDSVDEVRGRLYRQTEEAR